MSSENNGGKTSYYDLPRCTRSEIIAILNNFQIEIGKKKLSVKQEAQILTDTIDKIYSIFPDTLNDLIEHKRMEFWRGDAFKALYALEERALKGGNSSEERELNKIIYYCQRRLKRLEKDKPKMLSVSEWAAKNRIKENIDEDKEKLAGELARDNGFKDNTKEAIEDKDL